MLNKTHDCRGPRSNVRVGRMPASRRSQRFVSNEDVHMWISPGRETIFFSFIETINVVKMMKENKKMKKMKRRNVQSVLYLKRVRVLLNNDNKKSWFRRIEIYVIL